MSELRFPWQRSRPETAPARPGSVEVLRAETALAWLDATWDARVEREAAVGFGRALAGDRVTVDARDGIGAGLGILRRAADTRVPLLARVAIEDTALLSALAATGALVAVARSLQDLLDLSLELRWLSERALLPAVLAYEGTLGNAAIQDLVLPDAAEILRLFPRGSRPSSSRTEEVLFGAVRSAVPAWFDFDRPVGTDGRGVGAAGAVARIAARAFLDVPETEAATEALAALGLDTRPVIVAGRSDAPVAVVLVGTAAEDVLAAKGANEHRLVILRRIAPFPGEACARALAGARVVSVWTAEADPSALTTSVRASLQSGGAERMAIGHLTAGVGGLALRPADVEEAFARLVGKGKGNGSLPTDGLLGWALAPEDPSRPHRDALHAALRRDHPEAVGRAVVAPRGNPAAAPSGGERRGGNHDPVNEALRVLARPGISWLDEAAGLLQGLLGGTVRSRLVETARGEREFLQVARTAAEFDWCRTDGPIDLHLPEDLGDLGVAGEEAVGWAEDARVLGAVIAEIAARRSDLAPQLAERPLRSLLAQRLLALEPDARAQRTEALVAGVAAQLARRAQREPTASAVLPEAEPPAALGQLGGDGTLIDPARAWHQAIRPWEESGPDSLVPEPGRIASARPVLATAFLRCSLGENLPAIDLGVCTGCAACWSVCPESAIQAHADTPARLVEQALDAAGSAAAPLRRGARPIAQNLTRLVAEAEPGCLDLASLVHRVGSEWVEKNAAEAQRATLDSALDAVVLTAGGPRARTEVFWEGVGEKHRSLLTLAVDPEACTSCGLCVQVCAPQAIRLRPAPADARAAWRSVQACPDTPGAVIAAVEEKLGLVPARLLSRHITQSFAGRREVPGSLGALSVRWVVSALEAGRQPKVMELRASLASLGERLAERIRSQVAESLPVHDLGALAAAISGAGERADLEALAHGLGAAEQAGRLDGGRLARIVDVARGIQDLRWKEDTGVLGAGRARFGLVVTPGVDWLAHFPAHPAFAPLRVEVAEDAVRVFAGLVLAQAERAGVEIALRREAERIVTSREAEPRSTPSALSWSELTAEERATVPPVVLVAREEEIASQLGILAEVLRGGGPAGVVILASDPVGAMIAPYSLLAAAGRSAVALQSSPVRPSHLGSALAPVVAAGRAFLLRLLAPEPADREEGTAAYARASAAVAEGRFPLFVYDPERSMVEAIVIEAESLARPDVRTGSAVWAELSPWVPRPPVESTGSSAPTGAAELERVRRETETQLVERLTNRLAEMWKSHANGGARPGAGTPRP